MDRIHSFMKSSRTKRKTFTGDSSVALLSPTCLFNMSDQTNAALVCIETSNQTFFNISVLSLSHSLNFLDKHFNEKHFLIITHPALNPPHCPHQSPPDTPFTHMKCSVQLGLTSYILTSCE